MAELRHFKDNENKVHEQLYDNLFLLSMIYPPTKEFNAIFKKDMFVKNNKTAFFEVVYYLLNILNPELTKQKLTTWPPYDIKRENKFRADLLKYINELNVLYDNADIPNMMSSHLISPGGLKFAKFILKLSQLVVYEHLKKTEEPDILYCPKPSKTIALTKANINNLKKRTSLIESETKELLNNFEKHHFDLKENALLIEKNLTKLNLKIQDAKKENMVTKKEFNKTYPSYPSLSSLEDKLKPLGDQWENLREVQNLFKECEKFMSYLSSSELILEHSKETLKLPDEILHVIKNREVLNLIEFFQGLHVLLERKALELPNPTSSYIKQYAVEVSTLNEKYSEMHNTLLENNKDLQSLIDKLSQDLKLLVELNVANNSSDSSDETLAVPLIDS